MKITIEDDEFWNTDILLAKINLKILKKFKKNKAGYPANLDNEKQWDKILSKIIKAFKIIASNNANPLVYHHPKVKKGLELYIRYMGNFWF
jgi:hypothetical protein